MVDKNVKNNQTFVEIHASEANMKKRYVIDFIISSILYLYINHVFVY